MKDYSHLKGKEVWCYLGSRYNTFDGKRSKIKCFVADIDFKKGITLKDMNGKNIVCLNRSDTYAVPYEDIFAYNIFAICYGSWFQTETPEHRRGMMMSNCAFE